MGIWGYLEWRTNGRGVQADGRVHLLMKDTWNQRSSAWNGEPVHPVTPGLPHPAPRQATPGKATPCPPPLRRPPRDQDPDEGQAEAAELVAPG